MGLFHRKIEAEPAPLPPTISGPPDLAKNVLEFGHFIPLGPLQFSEGDLTKSFESLGTYAKELKSLASLSRPGGRPVLSGIGLYPEMGGDLMPAVVARNFGHLIGMSMHEGELLNGAEILRMHQLRPEDVVGRFKGYSIVERDIEGVLSHLTDGEKAKALQRVNEGSRKMRRKYGLKDLERLGPLLEFENLTFLPSASGDERILDAYLRGRKLDYVILKGCQRYRWKAGDAGSEGGFTQWLDVLDRKYLADDGVVIASADDSLAIKHLKSKGYQEIPNPGRPAYPEGNISPLYVNTEFSPGTLAGAGLIVTNTDVSLLPKGEFTILHKKT